MSIITRFVGRHTRERAQRNSEKKEAVRRTRPLPGDLRRKLWTALIVFCLTAIGIGCICWMILLIRGGKEEEEPFQGKTIYKVVDLEIHEPQTERGARTDMQETPESGETNGFQTITEETFRPQRQDVPVRDTENVDMQPQTTKVINMLEDE